MLTSNTYGRENFLIRKEKDGIKKYLDTYERGVAFSVVQGGLGSFMND